jgi:RNA polymerase sigma-70 factor (ECF subfamily)
MRREGRIAERIGNGDVEALGELYDRHSTYAFRCALALLGDPALAAEAVQAAFLEVWHGAADDRPLPDALLAAVYRACVARRGSRRRLGQPAPVRALDGLPEEQRAAIVLARFAGLTVSETATVLGTTPEQVRRDLLAGLRAVRRSLGSGDGTGAPEGLAGADRVAYPRQPRPPLELKRQPGGAPENGPGAAVGDGEAARDRAVV